MTRGNCLPKPVEHGHPTAKARVDPGGSETAYGHDAVDSEAASKSRGQDGTERACEI
jgi:hypothetical protein